MQGTAKTPPFAGDGFDHALVATTICFLNSPALMLAQSRHALKPGGRLVIGAIDRDSALC